LENNGLYIAIISMYNFVYLDDLSCDIYELP